ncbi:MAG: flagellar basal body L-ring protein FlgH [Deltaproteobacteria bacterium]|nr:flagellar basal body L-ring protein FlgH [Deltaproteobacteria bacterium]
MKGKRLFGLILWTGLLVFGCGAHTENAKRGGGVVPEGTVAPLAQEQPLEGSLWRSDSTMASLYSDIKARRVGDIVTITIVESSSASESANTDTSRDSSVKAGVESFLGLEKQLASQYDNLNPAELLNASLSNNFKGTGKTVRSGNLTANITARIIEVLPNGNFVIEGKREVEVNHEAQYIVISGIIRPDDISRDNVVLSTYISDARIAYSGRGVVNDYQRPGWFTRFLNRTWPF